MNDIYQQLITYALGVWRRRWYVIAFAWLICGAGWTYVASMQDRYESSARIYVDVDTMLGPLMRGIAVQTNLFQQIDFMRRTLLSRPNVEKIILMTDLDLTIKNDTQREGLIVSLRNKISIRQQGRNLFKIAYSDTDKAMTKRVVQAVMQIFVEGNLGASRKDMDATQRFLRDQIRDYERQLVNAEERLAKFKRANMGFLSGGGNYYGNMEAKRTHLTQTEAAINEATMIRDELRIQLEDVPQFLEVISDISFDESSGGAGPESDLQLRILELQQVMDSLLTRYTEKHPDVVITKRRVVVLQKQLEQELAAQDAAMGDADPESPSGSKTPEQPKTMLPNPVYEQIKLQLVQQEGMIAALKNRLEQAHKDVAKWAGLADLVPQVEAQLVRLNRDYGIVRSGYQNLRARQESARMAQELETKAQSVQFRVIDPPKIPLEPSGPNRPLFHAMVLLSGIIGGVAFAFVLSQINASFSTIQKLRATFTLPVLGRISAIVSVGERRRRVRELMSFGTVFVALLIAFLSLVSIEKYGAANLIATAKQLVWF